MITAIVLCIFSIREKVRKMDKKRIMAISAIFIAMLMALPGSALLSGIALTENKVYVASNGFVLGTMTPFQKSYDQSVIDMNNFLGYTNESQKIGIVIGFSWRNNDQLKAFLADVNNPKSPNYRHFMTWEELKKNYSPNKELYDATVEWLKSNGIHIEHTWDLRNSISIIDTVGNIERVFHTKFGNFRGDGYTTKAVYYAALEPLQLPENIIPYVNGISGTNNAPLPHMHYYTKSGTDYCTGSDIAKIDRVFELYNDTSDGSANNKHIFATGLTVATVLWEGSTGFISKTEKAPYDPAAVNYYYQHVIPTWIQNLGVMSHVWGYGTASDCVKPGSNTDGSVSVENELDLEMVGTMAPGVTTVCVYSDSSFTNFPTDNYNYILNTLTHNTTLVAVSNSWGWRSETAVDATTMADVEALNALGVTVLASTGDSGKDTATTPATAAYDDYGFLAIGGTEPHPNGVDDTTIEDYATMAYNTNTENPRSSEPAWSGSQSGVSGIYPEPWWQNVTIGSGQGGRVVADISAMGTNTMIYISDGSGNNDWNTDYSGTSFSCPLLAGQLAEMAAYAGRYYDGEGSSTSQTPIYGFGFFVPTIYLLAYDYYHNGDYTSVPPFFDVTQGGNSDVNAGPGYDHPTGWGVPNGYEFIHDIGFQMSSDQSERTIYAGNSTYYDINIWFPYNWTSEVGHFQISGMPDHSSFSTDVGYVHPAGSGAQSHVRFTIYTSTSTTPGNYTLDIIAYTYNHTSGHWGNLSNDVQVTLNVKPVVVLNVSVGWNLISVPWLTSSYDVGSALNGLSWDKAMVYDNQNKVWHTYDVNRDAKYNLGFPSLDNKPGIWVHITGAGEKVGPGDNIGNTTITLYKGWNLVGYPSNTVRTVADALSGINYTYVQTYNATSGQMVTLGTSDYMMPGHAYWIYVPSTQTWTVSW
jgi:subtilase family serine protease